MKKNTFFKLNIGNGQAISVLELISTFERVNNVKVPFIYDKRREGDVCKVVADNSYAKSLLGWKPTRSLEEMCKNGWKWKCLNPRGYE